MDDREIRMLRSSSISLLSLALLAACQPKGLQISETAQPAPPMGSEVTCDVDAKKAWIERETGSLIAEASVTGPTCEKGVALLVIRDSQETPIFTWAGATRDIFGLKDATNVVAMRGALTDWIDQSNSMLATTENLPPWEETEGQPKRSEFPFHPEAWYDAVAWDALRKEKLDMFCFPQGGESLDCAALRDGQMETVGVQQFPG
jgi:hypothetical protein